MTRYPTREGLYDPAYEHDSCGVGFVADIAGRKSHNILDNAIQVLCNLEHRGACGCDPLTGDGAGISIQISDEFFRREWEEGDRIIGREAVELPETGKYAVGMFFLPQIPEDRHYCQGLIEEVIDDEGLVFIGWRKVPVDSGVIGEFSLDVEPRIKQAFITHGPEITSQQHFERKLYVARKRIQQVVFDQLPRALHYFYVASLSSRTLVYKGMLVPTQLRPYFPDLSDPAMKTAIAVVHSRYSTNTFPTWDLAHPFRYLAHNGEINTIRGNINWMRARENMIDNKSIFGDDFRKLIPVCRNTGSDSAVLDNALEFLVLGGRSLPHAMMMLIPEAWENDAAMDPEKRAFYEFHAGIMEPWDGPACVAFTDGISVGALLDRNGLRPSRYLVTKSGMVVMASETGVLDIPEEEISTKQRLQPGRMFLINTEEGRIIDDEEIKSSVSRRQPYRAWLAENKVRIDSLGSAPPTQTLSRANLLEMQRIFGYTVEDLGTVLAPMAGKGEEPIGSMGTDSPLAVMSDKPQLLYDYFRQMFAQVTNPPIDPIREENVMSTMIYVGGEGNMLDELPEQCHQIELRHPILSNNELDQIRHYSIRHFRTITLPMLYHADEGGARLKHALDELCARASEAIKNGYSILILSDRHVDAFRAPIPALLAVGAVHEHLVREKTRTKVGILVETGEAREVMHFCLLLGYGAGAVNPYLAFESIDDLARRGVIPEEISPESARRNYIKALNKGVLKVMSKMGISTLLSYHGAQIFEAIGISQEIIDRYFTATSSPIGGIGLDEIAEETRRRHARSFSKSPAERELLERGGRYRWRRGGERHLLNPDTIASLQHAVRSDSYDNFAAYSQMMNDDAQRLVSIRSLLEFQPATPVPLDEVEPAKVIVKRFATGAMSFGSISKEAHETLAVAMNRIGGRSNTGEGGEDPERYYAADNGNVRRSAIKQIASGRFGATTEYLMNAEEIQIKIAQGAKPGEGGQLPGYKVDEVIARVRHSTRGVGLISPPPHHDIYSIEDLAQLIYDLHSVNPEARVSVKLVSETGVGTIAAGVSKGKADVILISGCDGGTGASPLSSIQHAGTPWELGLSETHQVLVKNDLRGRVRLQVDGKLSTGRDLAIAAMLGAEEFGFATLPLISMGCIMMRKCHLNTCPVGVATQDPELRKKFQGRPEHVINFMFFIAEDLRRVMASLGFRTLDEMVGRVDMLRQSTTTHWKARHLDLSRIIHKQRVPRSIPTRNVKPQDHGLSGALDHKLIEAAAPALSSGQSVRASLAVRNTDRSIGSMISGRIARKYGHAGLPLDTILFTFTGSAGQSFGAWGAAGLTIKLCGDANDYVGKGLSGARLIIRPSEKAGYQAEENIIIGNVALYGAISGECFVRGRAGERFAVRNSGASAVVEGVGDHGCEYMTGGTVIVLGPTGRNFAAGMSGGVAYLFDPNDSFPANCNTQMVELEKPDGEDLLTIRRFIEVHISLTDSLHAKRILSEWEIARNQFTKVMPVDFKRALLAERARLSANEDRPVGTLAGSEAQL